jgi:DNA modification methylase
MGQIPRPPKALKASKRQDSAGRRPRRALTNIGGKVQVQSGKDGDQQLLTHALDVGPDEACATAHLHGFHSYPARLHASTAQRLIAGLTERGESVLDPFCGSGTVLLEAQIAGRQPFGVDANPLAIALTSLKLHRTTAEQRQELVALAKAVAESADARRLAKAGASRRHAPGAAAHFEPHVFLELDGLQWGIQQINEPFCRSALLLVLSAILNKVSRRVSDTSQVVERQRLASGFVIRFFVRKAQELAARMAELAKLLPQSQSNTANIKLGDAQRLPFRSASIQAVITSPPYPGIYDYVEHHRLRLNWLGLPTQHLEQHEIGAKRKVKHDPNLFRSQFNAQLQACLAEMARVLVPSGTAALVLADSVVGNTPWYADEEVSQLAERAGLILAAQAAQVRPHFHAPTAAAFNRRPRCERLLLLRPPSGNSRRKGPVLHRRSGG